MKVETLNIEKTTVEFYDDYIVKDYQIILDNIEIIAENFVKDNNQLYFLQ